MLELDELWLDELDSDVEDEERLLTELSDELDSLDEPELDALDTEELALDVESEDDESTSLERLDSVKARELLLE